MNGNGGHETDDYDDPMGRIAPRFRGKWMAALAPVRVMGTRWIVIVQERKDTALEPVEQMEVRTQWYGLSIVVMSVGLIGLMWYFVTRAMDDGGTRSWNRPRPVARPHRTERAKGLSSSPETSAG